MLKKQIFTYHNHTYRCGHGQGSEEQMVQAAIEAGYTEVGISDHAPFKGFHQPTDRMEWEDRLDYLRIMKELKEKYKDKAHIVVGFEVEYDRERLDVIKELRESCDYLLIGQHNKTMTNDIYNEEYTYYTSDEDCILYAKQVCEAMESGLFVALNHPDYFMLGRSKWNEACAEAARMIGECAARTHTPLEVNLKGVRRSKQHYMDGDFYSYPYREFFKEAAKYPIEVIYGQDAHYPFDFWRDEGELEKVNEILKGIELHQNLDFRIK